MQARKDINPNKKIVREDNMKIYAAFEREEDAYKVLDEMPYMELVKMNDNAPEEIRNKWVIVSEADLMAYYKQTETMVH
jgi:hypothetical protein